MGIIEKKSLHSVQPFFRRFRWLIPIKSYYQTRWSFIKKAGLLHRPVGFNGILSLEWGSKWKNSSDISCIIAFGCKWMSENELNFMCRTLVWKSSGRRTITVWVSGDDLLSASRGAFLRSRFCASLQWDAWPIWSVYSIAFLDFTASPRWSRVGIAVFSILKELDRLMGLFFSDRT